MRSLVGIFLSIYSVAAFSQPSDTTINYQGQLSQSGLPASGSYDFQFLLFDTDDFLTGDEIAGPVNLLGEPVVGGNFSVSVDFGPGVFSQDSLWIEIRVRQESSGGAFTTLSPRQQITAVPRAIVATESVDALNANVAQRALIADDVGANVIGVDNVNASQVQLRVANSCSIGSSIRSISSNGSVSCEVDTVGDTLTLNSTVFSVSEVRNNGRNSSTVNGPSVAGNICYLTYVRMQELDSTNEDGHCRIQTSGSVWQLEAFAEDDAEVQCSMRCFSY